MPNEQDHLETARQWQAYYQDSLREAGGMDVPAPKLGQSVNAYRRETARLIKREYLPPSHEYYKIQWRGLPSDVLDRLEPELIKTAVKEAWNPAYVPPGQLRERVITDARTGHKEHRFIGQQCFVKQMMRPGRRVSSFCANGHFWDASGRPLR
jgi:hypothetical protein